MAEVQNEYDRAMAAQNNEYALGQQKQQNDFNVAQWERQNQYNTPQAQMERYKAAGLNPNLIYSQGSSGNASSAPTSVGADLEAPARRVPQLNFGRTMPDLNLSEILRNSFDALQLLQDLSNKKKIGEGIDLDNTRKFQDNVIQQMGWSEPLQGSGLSKRKDAKSPWFDISPESPYYQKIMTELAGRGLQNVGQGFRNQGAESDLAMKRLLQEGQKSKNKLLEYQSDPYMYFGTSILKTLAPYLNKLPTLNVGNARRRR